MAALRYEPLTGRIQGRAGIARVKRHPCVSGDFFDEHEPATQPFRISVSVQVEHCEPDLVTNVTDETTDIGEGGGREVRVRHLRTDFLLSHCLMCFFDSELEVRVQRLGMRWAKFR